LREQLNVFEDGSRKRSSLWLFFAPLYYFEDEIRYTTVYLVKEKNMLVPKQNFFLMLPQRTTTVLTISSVTTIISVPVKVLHCD